MNKLIEDYNKSLEALSEYFNCEHFDQYIIQENSGYYWQISGEEVYYGEDEEDFEYSSEFKEFIMMKELTAIRVEDDFGGSDYWLVFNTDKLVEEE